MQTNTRIRNIDTSETHTSYIHANDAMPYTYKHPHTHTYIRNTKRAAINNVKHLGLPTEEIVEVVFENPSFLR